MLHGVLNSYNKYSIVIKFFPDLCRELHGDYKMRRHILVVTHLLFKVLGSYLLMTQNYVIELEQHCGKTNFNGTFSIHNVDSHLRSNG